jgi:hypothetical protein
MKDFAPCGGTSPSAAYLNLLREMAKTAVVKPGPGYRVLRQSPGSGTVLEILSAGGGITGQVGIFKFASSFWNTTAGSDSVPICGIYGYPYDFTTTGGTGVPILSASDLWLIGGETLTTGSAAGTKSYSYNWGGQQRVATWTASSVTHTEYDFVTPEYNSGRLIVAMQLNNPAVVVSGVPVQWLEVSPRYWANDMLYTPP